VAFMGVAQLNVSGRMYLSVEANYKFKDTTTVKPVMFACPLFCEFRELNKMLN